MKRILIIVGLCVVTVQADDKAEKLKRIVNVVKALSDTHKTFSPQAANRVLADSIVDVQAAQESLADNERRKAQAERAEQQRLQAIARREAAEKKAQEDARLKLIEDQRRVQAEQQRLAEIERQRVMQAQTERAEQQRLQEMERIKIARAHEQRLQQERERLEQEVQRIKALQKEAQRQFIEQSERDHARLQATLTQEFNNLTNLELADKTDIRRIEIERQQVMQAQAERAEQQRLQEMERIRNARAHEQRLQQERERLEQEIQRIKALQKEAQLQFIKKEERDRAGLQERWTQELDDLKNLELVDHIDARHAEQARQNRQAKLSAVPAQTSRTFGTWKKFTKMIDEIEQGVQEPVGPEFVKISGLVAEQAIIDGVPVYRLNVLNQREAAGGPWTCGFHSLKNVLYVLQALQTNPMSAHVAKQLQQALTSVNFFETVFLNGGRLNTPGDRSWLKSAQNFQDFLQNDGIFPDDQRILLHQIKEGACLYPASMIPGLERYVFPIHDFGQHLLLADIVIPEAFYHFSQNQWPSIAFTLPAAPREQHFIGVVLHKTNTSAGLEIFLLDSLNRDLIRSKSNLESIVSWYNNLKNMIIEKLTKKGGFVHSEVMQYDVRKNTPDGMLYMKEKGLIATLSTLFDIVQAVLVGNKILGRNSMDGELSAALSRVLCFYYKALDGFNFDPNTPFFYSNMTDDWVNVADATHGILPETYGELKPMLQSWADALDLPSLTNC